MQGAEGARWPSTSSTSSSSSEALSVASDASSSSALREELKGGSGKGQSRPWLGILRWVARRRWTCFFSVLEISVTAAWLAGVLPQVALRAIGGLLVVVASCVILGSRRPLAPPLPVRRAIGLAILGCTVAVAASPWLMGGPVACVREVGKAIDAINLDDSPGHHTVDLAVDVLCFCVVGAVAAYCAAMEGGLSLHGARTLWCLELTWAALAVDVLAALIFFCHGQREDEPTPVTTFLTGAADMGFAASLLMIWGFLLQRLMLLEAVLPQDFSSKNFRVVCWVGAGFALVCFVATTTGNWKVNGACLAVAAVLVLVCGSISSKGLLNIVLASAAEGHRYSGLLRKELFWATHVFRIELAAVLVTSITSCLHLAWRAQLNWVWDQRFTGPYLEISDSSSRAIYGADAVCNVLALAAMCGAFSRQRSAGSCLRPKKSMSNGSGSRLPADAEEGFDAGVWNAKVDELAHRGFRLEALLDFYALLLSPDSPMPSFDPARSSTNDVVREAVIPLSRHKDGSGGSALAVGWNKGERVLPDCMVTHSWSNVFTHLVAAIVAEAAGCDVYEALCALLAGGRIEQLKALLQTRGTLQRAYWVCAFCVNQHMGICGGFGPEPQDPEEHRAWEARRRDSVTGQPYPVCDCAEPKFFNNRPAECEMNKFDHMMELLSAANPEFRQVIAMDLDFGLLTRAWCVAELVQAQSCGMAQALVVHSRGDVDRHHCRLKQLDIRECEASRPEDKEQILSNIPDLEFFHECLYWLIFGNDGLFSEWVDRESKLQTAAQVVARTLSGREEACGKKAPAP